MNAINSYALQTAHIRLRDVKRSIAFRQKSDLHKI